MDIVNASSFLQKAIEQQIDEGKSVTLCVTGKSMRPYLSGNGKENVIVIKHKPEEITPGVIILFSYNNKYVFHRVIGKAGDLLIVQGDGNIKIEKVRCEDVLGIVRFVVRSGGKTVSTDSLAAGVYWRIWYILRPFRRYLLFLYNRMSK